MPLIRRCLLTLAGLLKGPHPSLFAGLRKAKVFNVLKCHQSRTDTTVALPLTTAQSLWSLCLSTACSQKQTPVSSLFLLSVFEKVSELPLKVSIEGLERRLESIGSLVLWLYVKKSRSYSSQDQQLLTWRAKCSSTRNPFQGGIADKCTIIFMLFISSAGEYICGPCGWVTGDCTSDFRSWLPAVLTGGSPHLI